MEISLNWAESVDRRLSYMGGQLLALNLALGCLLQSHPRPAAVMEAMRRECGDAMSHLLPTMLDDAFLEGMALVQDKFTGAASD
jgi:hypothetical protein